MENLEEDCGFLMLQVSSMWEECHDKALKKYHGISHMQYAVLAGVYWLTLHSKKQVTQAILAQHSRINPMTISQMFPVLEAKGYICRTRHLTDVRAKAVDITLAGKKMMQKAIKTIDEVDTKFFRVLGDDRARFNGYMVDLLKAND